MPNTHSIIFIFKSFQPVLFLIFGFCFVRRLLGASRFEAVDELFRAAAVLRYRIACDTAVGLGAISSRQNRSLDESALRSSAILLERG